MSSTLPPIHKYIPLILRQSFGAQELERRPEPDTITAADDKVEQYDRVMTTKLAVAYAVGLEVIYRSRQIPRGGSALDLACGPGHFSLCLASHLELDSLLGLDLSRGMIKVAGKNANEQGLPQASFDLADVTNLSNYDDNQFDLTTFTDAAHHMADLNTVERVIKEADRVTKPEGLVVVMDLVRLRTESITESYVQLVGGDYNERGLSAFYDDFYHSMYAAWAKEELAATIPNGTARNWYQLAPAGLPTIQFLLGVPCSQQSAFQRKGVPWSPGNHPLCSELRFDWRAMQMTVRIAKPILLETAT